MNRRVYDRAPWLDAVLLAVVAFALLAAIVLHGCGGDAVRRQITMADITARAMNRALPLWINGFERECAAAIDAEPDEASAQIALDRCVTRWNTVRTAWETAREAHSVWRATLERCRQPDASTATCELLTRENAAAFLGATNRWRCAMRAIGRADLDQLPGPAECQEAP